jgi:hypothetical protein
MTTAQHVSEKNGQNRLVICAAEGCTSASFLLGQLGVAPAGGAQDIHEKTAKASHFITKQPNSRT